VKLKSSSHSDERDRSVLIGVDVDLPDALKLVTQIEAKRKGLSLEQWVGNALTASLTGDLNGEVARG
jgi:hypothetical protein